MEVRGRAGVHLDRAKALRGAEAGLVATIAIGAPVGALVATDSRAMPPADAQARWHPAGGLDAMPFNREWPVCSWTRDLRRPSWSPNRKP